MAMLNDLMGWNFAFAFMDYGDTWRQHRKLMHQAFHPAAAEGYRPQQLRTARSLAHRLLTTSDFHADIRYWAGQTILSISYGIDTQPRNDPYIEIAEKGVYPILEAAVPGAYLVDSFSILKYIPDWMPGASFKKKAKEWKACADEMRARPFEATLQNIKDKSAKPSFTLDGLEKVAQNFGSAYTEENVKSVAAGMYQAGSDTTVAGLSVLILALLDHPHVIKKVQEELDLVTEQTRFPDFGDEGCLPYLTAVVKETMRWWTLGPTDEYKGYRIPAGTLVLGNVWAILHDEKIFPDPFVYNPDRFLDETKTMKNYLTAAWGFGRR
ncbi:unnamed protein product [Cyclocybe aegerita]|uniref:Cytochrome P450 n=1 Tax=Cyclocybe aegerita TaxID=1973307 RepID=A0A8S0XYR5_CYCAE|nr:unnamed protein product [Cyclocybe aegerita]